MYIFKHYIINLDNIIDLIHDDIILFIMFCIYNNNDNNISNIILN